MIGQLLSFESKPQINHPLIFTEIPHCGLLSYPQYFKLDDETSPLLKEMDHRNLNE